MHSQQQKLCSFPHKINLDRYSIPLSQTLSRVSFHKHSLKTAAMSNSLKNKHKKSLCAPNFQVSITETFYNRTRPCFASPCLIKRQKIKQRRKGRGERKNESSNLNLKHNHHRKHNEAKRKPQIPYMTRKCLLE